jgi:hypothetical protein
MELTFQPVNADNNRGETIHDFARHCSRIASWVSRRRSQSARV